MVVDNLLLSAMRLLGAGGSSTNECTGGTLEKNRMKHTTGAATHTPQDLRTLMAIICF